MTCSDCGQTTIMDGVCIDCSNKRFDDYPSLKLIQKKLKNVLEKFDMNRHNYSKQDMEYLIDEIAKIVWRCDTEKPISQGVKQQ